MKKRTVLLLSLAALILLGALCLQAGLFAHENQQPYSLYWDGQLYRSYAEEWKEPVTEDALIVELDGSQHFETKEAKKDQARTAYFHTLGIRVLRFANNDIDQNLTGVCQTIIQVLEHCGVAAAFHFP